MSTIYCVVYGSSWDDIMVFQDREKAVQKLRIQSLKASNFKPFLSIMNEHKGIFYRAKERYFMSEDSDQLVITT